MTASATRGFVLALTLALLSLLVVAAMGISVTSRLSTRFAETSGQRTRARANALMALGVALGELDRATGSGGALTGMGGVTGIPPGTGGGKRRHWCGVWPTSASVPAWLVSGVAPARVPQLASGSAAVVMVGAKSVGAESSNSEHIVAGRMSVEAWRPGGSSSEVQGGYAWWIGDEGVKISAGQVPGSTTPVVGVQPPATPSNANTLRSALQTHSAQLGRVVMYEQLRFITSPSAPLTNTVIWDNFHSVSLRTAVVEGGALLGGRINLNTTSAPVWRGILEAYNRTPGAKALPATRITSIANALQDGIAGAAGGGKSAGGPFPSVAAFAASALVTTVFAGTQISSAELAAFFAGVLATRSDTFRIRAYGDATAPDGSIVARAYCEALVQRSTTDAFRMVYFRWQGADDV